MILRYLRDSAEKLVSSGVGQIQHGVDRILHASVDRLAPIREIREETTVLRQRLEELEATLERLETAPGDASESDRKD
jgi:hypothetical protein